MTKWTEARATAHATAAETCSFFSQQIVFRLGTPVAVATDNGTHFRAEFETLLAKLGVGHHWGSPYHPQSTGQAERTNGLILNRLRRWYTGDGPYEWDRYLQPAVLSINSRRSQRLKYSPMEALFGRRPKQPLESRALMARTTDLASRFAAADVFAEPDCSDRLCVLGSIRDDTLLLTTEIDQKMEERYNSRVRHVDFYPGDQVLMRTRIEQTKGKKLLKRWRGPGTVIRVYDWGAVEVRDGNGQYWNFNVDDLKHFLG